jgi:hypothetical protein
MSRGIPLTKGRVAIVDENLYDWLNQWKWLCLTTSNGNAYAARCIGWKGPWVLMHRLIMNAPDGTEVDHKDGNGLNNVISNLRICNHSQNGMNRSKQQGEYTSKYKGVSFDGRPNYKNHPWRAAIQACNIQHDLGHFDTEIEAIKAYNEAAVYYFGEFAYTNAIPEGDK